MPTGVQPPNNHVPPCVVGPRQRATPQDRCVRDQRGLRGGQLALANGLPLVATGGKEDKPEVGARVAWTGAGIRFRQERPSPSALRKAIRRILDDERYRTEAQRLAVCMARSSGVAGLANLVDALSATRNAID